MPLRRPQAQGVAVVVVVVVAGGRVVVVVVAGGRVVVVVVAGGRVVVVVVVGVATGVAAVTGAGTGNVHMALAQSVGVVGDRHVDAGERREGPHRHRWPRREAGQCRIGGADATEESDQLGTSHPSGVT